MSKADSYLIAGALVVAVLSAVLFHRGFFPRTAETVGSRAVIKVHGRSVRTIELSRNGGKAVYSVLGMMGPAKVEVEGKRVRMSEAPCPDRICVRGGWIDRPGESIVCIPNQMEMYIESGIGLDAVTR
jgi:hypothetical protein